MLKDSQKIRKEKKDFDIKFKKLCETLRILRVSLRNKI